MQIIISNQTEYDNAVKSGRRPENELVIQNASDFILVHTNVTVGKNGRCRTDGASTAVITVKENGVVAAEGKTIVAGYDNANIIAKDNCRITLHDAAFGSCYDHCNVTLKDSSKISADGNCTVNAYDESFVSASGSSKVHSYQSVTAKGSDVTSIMAKDNCIVYATDNCKVQAHDNCLVVADKNARVVSQDNCLVMSNGSPELTLSDQCGHVNLDDVNDKNIMGALKQMAQSKAVVERPLVAIQILKENIPPARQEAVNKRLNTMGLKNQIAIKNHIYSLVEAETAPIQKNQSQNQNFEKQLELARKTGYVQGVCECAAIVGEEKNLGKKLLAEMNVTKDMAKKHAHPETYKTLEHGVFAPKQEHKLERTQGVKR